MHLVLPAVSSLCHQHTPAAYQQQPLQH
uniref:MS1 n=1 Tax=Arundo donax TaxID=35708 RepID=A0A0A9G0Y3_ARUDO